VQQLKMLVDHIWLIESKEAVRWWIQEIKAWEQHNWNYLREYRRDTNGKWWYIHKGARKALSILKVAPYICFTFLSHHLLPKTTNELEAQIGVLEMKHLIHRGLRRTRTTNFIDWFVYFYNRNLLSQKKK